MKQILLITNHRKSTYWDNRIHFILIGLFLLFIFLSTSCSPVYTASDISSEGPMQADTNQQDEVVIITATESPLPTSIPTEIIEPTIYPQPTPEPENVYPECSQASIGDNVTCVIMQSSCSYMPKIKGKPTFCNDAPYPGNNFTFLAWGEDLSQYDGKCLIVTGMATLYKGKPEIIGTESSLSVCDHGIQ